MDLALTEAIWHGHAGIDKWIGLVWTESKLDQNKIASDVASKLNQRRRPGESWHKDTIHLLEQYRRTTSVAYPPAIAVDTLLTHLNLSPGFYAADKVLLCRAATVPAESTLLTEVNRAIVSLLHESSRRGDHRVCRSAEDLRRHPSLSPFNARPGQSTRAGRGRMVNGRVQAATFSLWMGSNQGSHVVDHERFWRWSTIYSLVCGESCSVSTSASRRINYIVLF
jgi:hypothetical protein